MLPLQLGRQVSGCGSESAVQMGRYKEKLKNCDTFFGGNCSAMDKGKDWRFNYGLNVKSRVLYLLLSRCLNKLGAGNLKLQNIQQKAEELEMTHAHCSDRMGTALTRANQS